MSLRVETSLLSRDESSCLPPFDPDTPRPKTSRRVPSPHIAQFTDYIPKKSAGTSSAVFDDLLCINMDNFSRTDDEKCHNDDDGGDDYGQHQKLAEIGARIVRFMRDEKGRSKLKDWEHVLVAIVSRNLLTSRNLITKRETEGGQLPPWLDVEKYRSIMNSVSEKLRTSPKDAEEVVGTIETWRENHGNKKIFKISTIQDTGESEMMFEKLQEEFETWIHELSDDSISREDLIRLSDLVLRLVGCDSEDVARNIRDRFLVHKSSSSLDAILDTASQVVYEECMFRKVAGRVDDSYRSEMNELRTQLKNLEERRRDLLIQWRQDRDRLLSGREKSSQFDAMSGVWGSRMSMLFFDIVVHTHTHTQHF